MTGRIVVGDTPRLGVVIGGSGLVGGTIVNYFKTRPKTSIDILAPSSKKLSIRNPSDIQDYLQSTKPAFVVNTAISNIDSDEQLSFEVNFLGPLNIAQTAAAQKIPYIHISSAATLKLGEDILEKNQKPFSPRMSNYTKSKLMAEKMLEHMCQSAGLDYTCIRLAAVYGKHDHKIQGFHRMLFSVADDSMPVLFTKKDTLHSYSNCRKLPFFIHHMLDRRDEYSSGDYNFVDRNPVDLATLILTIKSYLQSNYPKEIYIPYSVANGGRKGILWLLKILRKFGLKSELPPELIFLSQFYITQTLNSERLKQSSFKDPFPEETIFSRLPEMIAYYLTRWSHQNLISTYPDEAKIDYSFIKTFRHNPEKLLETIHQGEIVEFTGETQGKNQAAKFDRFSETFEQEL